MRCLVLLVLFGIATAWFQKAEPTVRNLTLRGDVRSAKVEHEVGNVLPFAGRASWDTIQALPEMWLSVTCELWPPATDWGLPRWGDDFVRTLAMRWKRYGVFETLPITSEAIKIRLGDVQKLPTK